MNGEEGGGRRSELFGDILTSFGSPRTCSECLVASEAFQRFPEIFGFGFGTIARQYTKAKPPRRQCSIHMTTSKTWSCTHRRRAGSHPDSWGQEARGTN